MGKWFHGLFRSAPRKSWAPTLNIAGTDFFNRRVTPMRAAVVARYQRRARLLRSTGDEHDHKMAIKLLRRCAA